jgi:hypothetical protein
LAAGALSPALAFAAEKKHTLKKAVKFGMIKVPGASIEDKFKLVKSLGFEGGFRDQMRHGVWRCIG